MTSKQALNDLIDEMKYTENDGKTLTSYDQKRVDAIMKDLEVLEILKKHLFIRIMDIPAFDGTYIVSLLDKEEQEWDYTCIFVSEEEKEKIKEWLNNE